MKKLAILVLLTTTLMFNSCTNYMDENDKNHVLSLTKSKIRQTVDTRGIKQGEINNGKLVYMNGSLSFPNTEYKSNVRCFEADGFNNYKWEVSAYYRVDFNGYWKTGYGIATINQNGNNFTMIDFKLKEK